MTDVAEFKSALKKGLGRTMPLLRRNPTSQDLHAELMHACKTNLIYDRQCEEARAPYLYRLILETGQSQSYWIDLLKTFQDASGASDEIDRVQIFEILCLLAPGRDASDRLKLQSLFLSSDFDTIARDCMEALALLWQFRFWDIRREPLTVRASSGLGACEKVEDGLPDCRHARLWRRSRDSFFSVPLL
jgi:hypothetical protein